MIIIGVAIVCHCHHHHHHHHHPHRCCRRHHHHHDHHGHHRRNHQYYNNFGIFKSVSHLPSFGHAAYPIFPVIISFFQTFLAVSFPAKVSVGICSFHAMAEASRFMLLYVDYSQNGDMNVLLPFMSPFWL